MHMFACLFVIALLAGSGNHAETGKHAHAMVVLLPMDRYHMRFQLGGLSCQQNVFFIPGRPFVTS